MSELPVGWATATLEEVSGVGGLVSDGDWIESRDQDPGGTIRLIQLMDVGDGRFIDRSKRFLNEETAERLRCTRLRAGDLLIARMPDPLGRACVFPGVGQEAVTAVDVLIWRAGIDAVFPEWLKYTINSPDVRDELALKAGGTTRQRVAGGVLKKLELPVPPLAEQRRIVAKLDALTARTARARADLDRIIALAARYKQAVLAKAFSGELTAEWRAANAVVEASWRRSDVGSLTTDVRYGTATKCAFSPSETPVLRIPNIAKGRIDTTDLKHASFDERERAKLALKAGDVLVIRSNGSLSLVGRAAVATEEVAGFLYAGYLIRLRLDMERVSPEFLQLAFEEPSIRAVIEGFAKSTSGVNNINSEQLKSLMVPLPSLVEQAEIVRRVGIAFAEIDRLTTEAAAAQRLTDRLDQAVLAKAFRGELVRQDPADEPASVLLDRIRAERAAASKTKRARKPVAA